MKHLCTCTDDRICNYCINNKIEEILQNLELALEDIIDIPDSDLISKELEPVVELLWECMGAYENASFEWREINKIKQ